MNMNVDNKINIEDIKKDLKDFVKYAKFPYYEKNSKDNKLVERNRILLAICCVVAWIASLIFAIHTKLPIGFVGVYLCLVVCIIIYLAVDVVIFNSIISKHNKKDLLERINQATTYIDISEIIDFINFRFEKIIKRTEHGLFDFTVLKDNIDDYYFLTDNILSTSVLINEKNKVGKINIKQQDNDGYIDEKTINVEVRENAKLREMVITIYPYEMIKLDVPYFKEQN